MPRPSSKKSGGGSSRKKGVQKQDAIDLLKADHETVLALFQRHTAAQPDEQQALAKQIFTALDIHSTLEEEIFYPALREQGDLKELSELEGDEEDVEPVNGRELSAVEEETEESEEQDDNGEESLAVDEAEEVEGEDLITLAYEDHKAVRELIQELKTLDPSTDRYRNRFEELEEAVTDHVGEEEEVLFPEAKLKLDTKQLGAELVKRRSDLSSSMAA